MIKLPPKNRDFLGLVKDDENGELYWEIFFWATKKDGVHKACYVDRMLFAMPELLRWEELPSYEE